MAACASQPLTSQRITHVSGFDKSFEVPIAARVAHYIPAEEANRQSKTILNGVTFTIESGEQFSKAAGIVFPHFFSEPSALDLGQPYNLVYRLAFDLRIDAFFGSFTATVTGEVIDPTGGSLYGGSATSSATSGNVNDANAANYALGQAMAKLIQQSLQTLGPQRVAELTAASAAHTVVIKKTANVSSLKLTRTGTGFFVNRAGMLVTANHVVSGCLHLELHRAGEHVDADLVASDRFADLALLHTAMTAPAVPGLPAGDPPRLGEDIMLLSYPLSDVLSESPVFTMGNVSSLQGVKADPLTFQITAPVQSGTSGAPVVNRSGALRGVVTATLGSSRDGGAMAQNANFAVKTETLRRFLDTNHASYDSATNGAELGTEAIARAMQDYVVLVACHG